MPNWDPNDEDHVGFAGPHSDERPTFGRSNVADDRDGWDFYANRKREYMNDDDQFNTFPEPEYAVEIEHHLDQIVVKSKYNDNLIRAWKMIPSRQWHQDDGVTTFHISHKAQVYAAMVLTIPGANCIGPGGEFTVAGGRPIVKRGPFTRPSQPAEPRVARFSDRSQRLVNSMSLTDPSYYSDDDEGDEWHPGHPSNYGNR